MSIRIAVVGCGQWGRNHVRTLAEIGALAAVADADEARAAEFAERFGVPARTLDALLADPAIDALVLAMPPRLHGETARRAMRAGKHVLVEKPIALDPADAEESARVAAETGRQLMVGHVLRFHPVFERLDALVREGRIGTIRHIVSTRLGLGRFLGMDAVWDLAPHDLSLVLQLAGRAPVGIQTLRRTVLSDETDEAEIALDFGEGLTASIRVSRVSAYRDRRLTAVGTDGMLVFDDLEAEGRKLAFHAHTVRREGAGFTFRHADPEYLETEPGLPLDRELRDFIRAIGSGEPVRTGVAEAVETVRILSLASPRG